MNWKRKEDLSTSRMTRQRDARLLAWTGPAVLVVYCRQAAGGAFCGGTLNPVAEVRGGSAASVAAGDAGVAAGRCACSCTYTVLVTHKMQLELKYIHTNNRR